MAKQKKYQDFGFTLQIFNNTAINQQLNILGNPANLLDTANAVTEYQWDVTGLNPIGTVMLQYQSVGAASFTTYTASGVTDIPSLVAALNGLGIGYFNTYTVAGNTYISTYNDNYVFGGLSIAASIQWSWLFAPSIHNTPSFTITGSGISGTVNWGDGVSTALINGVNSHTYTNFRPRDVSIIYNGDITALSFLNLEPVLGAALSNFNFKTKLSNTITSLVFSNCNTLGTFGNPPYAQPYEYLSNGLQILELSAAGILNFNTSVPLPSTLTTLNLSHSIDTAFAPTIPLPSGLQILDLSKNNLNTAGINTSLIYINALGYSAPFSLNITTVLGGVPPTGAGLAAKNALISRGCTVITD